jgi:hypothetical protein
MKPGEYILVTENLAPVRGSVAPLPVLICSGFLPINLQLTRASKQRFLFGTILKPDKYRNSTKTHERINGGVFELTRV